MYDLVVNMFEGHLGNWRLESLQMTSHQLHNNVQWTKHVCDMFFIPTLNISCCISMKKEHMFKI